jgi:hypothetical protein
MADMSLNTVDPQDLIQVRKSAAKRCQITARETDSRYLFLQQATRVNIQMDLGTDTLREL